MNRQLAEMERDIQKAEKSHNRFKEFFNVFMILLFTLEVFNAGWNFQEGDAERGVINLVLAALWGGLFLFEWINRGRELKYYKKRYNESMDLIGEALYVLERATAKKKATKKKGSK